MARPGSRVPLLLPRSRAGDIAPPSAATFFKGRGALPQGRALRLVLHRQLRPGDIIMAVRARRMEREGQQPIAWRCRGLLTGGGVWQAPSPTIIAG